MRMLSARIRKQDQVNGDTVLMQPNKKGGIVVDGGSTLGA